MINSAEQIVKKLHDAGFEAYFAGGAVRDMLMGKEPKDIDIATSAKPEEIEALFEKTIPIGKKFGVILASINEHHFEIATFRSDSGYSDGRRPDFVTFTNAKEDALRRDFTINGLFYDPLKKVFLNYVSGREDLSNKIIRLIGNPDERIKEDALRILRAIRFKNVLEFQYDKETWETICKRKDLIKNISAERIKDELNKMIDGKFRYQAFKDLDKCGLSDIILPELTKGKGVKQGAPYHLEGDVFSHSLEAIKALPKNAPHFVAWATLLHDIGKPDTYEKGPDRVHFNAHAQLSADLTKDILKRLKFPNMEIELITWLVENHMTIGDIPKMREAKRRLFLLDHRFKWLLMLHKADAMGSKPVDLRMYEETIKMLKNEKGKKIPKPILTGDEVIKELGIEPGPKIGEILEKVHEAQIEGKIKTKKEALEFIKKEKER